LPWSHAKRQNAIRTISHAEQFIVLALAGVAESTTAGGVACPTDENRVLGEQLKGKRIGRRRGSGPNALQ